MKKNKIDKQRDKTATYLLHDESPTISITLSCDATTLTETKLRKYSRVFEALASKQGGKYSKFKIEE